MAGTSLDDHSSEDQLMPGYFTRKQKPASSLAFDRPSCVSPTHAQRFSCYPDGRTTATNVVYLKFGLKEPVSGSKPPKKGLGFHPMRCIGAVL